LLLDGREIDVWMIEPFRRQRTKLEVEDSTLQNKFDRQHKLDVHVSTFWQDKKIFWTEIPHLDLAINVLIFINFMTFRQNLKSYGRSTYG